ncbi:MAG: ABC transporter permease [Clostridia bacterium]|jgi:ribose transport system permease protein|nr:ABC transporter permease [Clostridia bacterium]
MKRKFNVGDFLSKYAIVLVLIALFVFFWIASDTFLSRMNVFNIFKQVAVVGIVSVGMTMVLLTAGIDLSVGSIIGVACVLTSVLLVSGMNAGLAILITLVVCAALGMLNAFFINQLKIPPLITTLGMMTTLRGVAYLITGGMPIFGFDSAILVLGKGMVFDVIPVPMIIMIVIFILGWLFLDKTRFGRHIYGVGGNEEATRLSGINVKKVKYIVYSISGFLSGLAGIVLLARINSGTPKAGDGYEMDVITAVVLGGVSISGGEGKIGFVIIGVMFMGVLTNGMIMLNVQEYVQWVIKGFALLAAVSFDRVVQNRKAKVA